MWNGPWLPPCGDLKGEEREGKEEIWRFECVRCDLISGKARGGGGGYILSVQKANDSVTKQYRELDSINSSLTKKTPTPHIFQHKIFCSSNPQP